MNWFGIAYLDLVIWPCLAAGLILAVVVRVLYFRLVIETRAWQVASPARVRAEALGIGLATIPLPAFLFAAADGGWVVAAVLVGVGLVTFRGVWKAATAISFAGILVIGVGGQLAGMGYSGKIGGESLVPERSRLAAVPDAAATSELAATTAAAPPEEEEIAP